MSFDALALSIQAILKLLITNKNGEIKKTFLFKFIFLSLLDLWF